MPAMSKQLPASGTRRGCGLVCGAVAAGTAFLSSGEDFAVAPASRLALQQSSAPLADSPAAPLPAQASAAAFAGSSTAVASAATAAVLVAGGARKSRRNQQKREAVARSTLNAANLHAYIYGRRGKRSAGGGGEEAVAS